ncbi:2TM domain-containing protein [Isoptericola haloaureus]|uniref:2TM domain-containing protein n=1 Tax=Isoptericola haloaureus TaxID=1542902 RepID=A0ABU7ZB51_9MICO
METDRDELARRRAKYATGLLWHVGAFVIINVFFWVLDLALGPPGATWAFWVTGFWGLGLAFHLLAFLIDGRQVEDRLTRKYEQRQDR